MDGRSRYNIKTVEKWRPKVPRDEKHHHETPDRSLKIKGNRAVYFIHQHFPPYSDILDIECTSINNNATIDLQAWSMYTIFIHFCTTWRSYQWNIIQVTFVNIQRVFYQDWQGQDNVVSNPSSIKHFDSEKCCRMQWAKNQCVFQLSA